MGMGTVRPETTGARGGEAANARVERVNLLSRREFLSGVAYAGAAAAGMSLAGMRGPVKHFAAIAAPASVTLRMLVVDIGVYVQGVRDAIEAFRQSQGGRYGHVAIQVETAPFAQLFPRIQAAVAAGASPDLLMVDGPLTKNYAFNLNPARRRSGFEPVDAIERVLDEFLL
jgi:ABC-type glycerol-3-phosphate transport system substrate-binding protein